MSVHFGACLLNVAYTPTAPDTVKQALAELPKQLNLKRFDTKAPQRTMFDVNQAGDTLTIFDHNEQSRTNKPVLYAKQQYDASKNEAKLTVITEDDATIWYTKPMGKGVKVFLSAAELIPFLKGFFLHSGLSMHNLDRAEGSSPKSLQEMRQVLKV